MEALCLLGSGRKMRAIGKVENAMIPDVLCNFGDCRIELQEQRAQRRDAGRGRLGVLGTVESRWRYPHARDEGTVDLYRIHLLSRAICAICTVASHLLTMLHRTG